MLKKIFIISIVLQSSALVCMQRLTKILKPRLLVNVLKRNPKFIRSFSNEIRFKKTEEKLKDAGWGSVIKLLKNGDIPSIEQIQNLSHDAKLRLLFLAIKDGRGYFVKFLVEHGDINLNAYDGKYNLCPIVPLNEAISSSKDKTDIISCLVDNGALVNLIDRLKNEEDQPLDLALLNEYYNVAKILFEHGAKTENAYEHLIRAIELNDLSMIRFLLDIGTNPNKLTKLGISFLDYALRFEKDIEIINLLIKKGGVISSDNDFLLSRSNKPGYRDLLLNKIKTKPEYYKQFGQKLFDSVIKELDHEVIVCLLQTDMECDYCEVLQKSKDALKIKVNYEKDESKISLYKHAYKKIYNTLYSYAVFW